LELEVRGHLLEIAQERRAAPTDDVISLLVHGVIDDPDVGARPLTEEELGDYCFILYAGGNSTTSDMLGFMAHLLSKYPDQRALLLERRDLVPNAIEEVLRYEPVSHLQGRTVMRDVEVLGEIVPEGAQVLLLTASACRDERRYENPDAFDVARDVGNHMAFGWGVHSCLGANLARLEGRIALEEMLDRFPRWMVDETNASLQVTTTVRGYRRLPIAV
jgi:cytochrome P450